MLIGHDQIRLKKEPLFQATLLDEYIHVDGDCSKAEKVTRSIRRDISSRAYLYVYYASLSAEEDALQAIYNFLRVGFAMGAGVLENYTHPHVMRIIELYRSVGNESHHFREFARFQSLDGRVYVSHLEPKSDVIMLVGRHFADRMPSEYWMIVDEDVYKRQLYCVAILTAWLNSGINFLYFSAGLGNIDETIYERASVDGASGVQQFFSLTLPGLSPIMFYTVVVNIIQAFQSFGQIKILTEGGPNESTNVIVYSIYRDAFFNYRFGSASAQSVVLFVIIMLVTLVMFRIEKKGVNY